MLVLYGIPHCDTVKKARAWLDGRAIAYRFHDFKKDGLPSDRLDQWLTHLDWTHLMNRKGTTWRQLAPADQAAVCDAASASALMHRQPSVIKRPVVDWGDATTVGFDPAGWDTRLAQRPANARTGWRPGGR